MASSSSTSAARARASPTLVEERLEVIADRRGERLDMLVARACGLSRARAQRLIAEGCVMPLPRAGAGPGQSATARARAGERLDGGEAFVVSLPPSEPAEPRAESIRLNIVYEDEHLIVVDKPAGMAVHPGPGHAGGTLVNALLAHCPDLPGIGGVQRPGIVHRLDKDTSGLIVVAKTERAHHGLSAQLKARQVKKTYLALVEGVPEPGEALIDAPIGRDPNNRRRMMVIASGRPAQTAYRVVEEFGAGSGEVPRRGKPGAGRGRGRGRAGEAVAAVCSLVEASPVTGRTHQVRVHLAAIGHAIAGDPVYGRPAPGVPRLFLHAWRLAFRHPVTGAEIALEAPLAEDLAAAIARLPAASKQLE